jgi:hypothetical protein
MTTYLKLSKLSFSSKMFLSSILCSIGVSYLLLLLHIWIDTQMKPAMIEKAYGAMEYIELTGQAHTYYPYYALILFFIPVGIFMASSYSSKLKTFFAIFPFVITFIDIGSMYAIPYIGKTFSYVLWTAGTCLALSFCTLFILNMLDLWIRRPKTDTEEVTV